MDAKMIAHGILDGLSSIPHGMYLGVVRTWEDLGVTGNREKYRNQEETERFFLMIKSLGNPESPLRRLITIVITEFYQKLDERGKAAVDNQLGYGAGAIGARVTGQIVIAQTVASQIIKRVMIDKAFQHFVRFTTSAFLNVVMIQGLIEESARASRRMSKRFPMTYIRVKRENLDMVYFLVEKQLEPYLVFIESHPIDCKEIQNEVCKIVFN
ncbi:hypothetical protein FEM41_24140 [Jejubacter calystegiae]|uniref:Uncharacterized protein n=1 Tax=Jejubacter calystegiae TaxID=2579935 RepID=A0A4V1G8A9_9ENTR|nr:hypothetical protein [Jejubacter calystegiae]QCT22507.1 hypothetical protein FEM41_24140 [Jejubacter calystegiae]